MYTYRDCNTAWKLSVVYVIGYSLPKQADRSLMHDTCRFCSEYYLL